MEDWLKIIKWINWYNKMQNLIKQINPFVPNAHFL